MTLDQHANYREKLGPLNEASDKRVTMVKCPDQDGCEAYLMQIKMPMFMTNRVFPNLYYVVERRNGTLEYIMSSQGSEELQQQQAKKIGKDVVANSIISYFEIKPTDDGCDVRSVVCLDIGGSIPDALKRQGVSESIDGLEKSHYIVRHGKVPKK